MKQNRHARFFATFAIAVFLGTAAVPARARQTVDYAPGFTPRDVMTIEQDLALDQKQRAALATRFEAYAEAFRASSDDVRERVSALRATLDGQGDSWEAAIQRTQSERGRILAAWLVDRQGMRDAFVADVQTLLTDEQAARWPDLDRRQRRKKTLGRGRLAGESLDLFLTVRGLGPPPTPTPEISALLDAYAVDLDDVLRARNDLPIRFGFDYTPERDVAARQAVRDVNLEYANLIAAELPPERSEAFRDVINRTAFARVYRHTGARTRLRSAATILELEETRRAAVLGLEAEYLARLGELCDRLRETIRRHEPEAYLRRLEQSNRRLENPPGEDDEVDPIQSGFRERRALDEEIVTRLRSLLTPEQGDELLGKARQPDGSRPEKGRTTIEQQAWVMDQFDANRDGRLDDAELEDLKEYLRTPRDRRER